MNRPCDEHSGICANIKNTGVKLEGERRERIDDVRDIWRAIDGMRKWVIVGMGTVIVQGGGALLFVLWKAIEAK